MKLKKLIRNLERLNIEFQSQNGRDGAYPDYFGENRDGYMFITDTINDCYLWFVVDIRKHHFNVDVLKTDMVKQCTTAVELCCNLSYRDMVEYILGMIKLFDTSQLLQSICSMFIQFTHSTTCKDSSLTRRASLRVFFFFEKA